VRHASARFARDPVGLAVMGACPGHPDTYGLWTRPLPGSGVEPVCSVMGEPIAVTPPPTVPVAGQACPPGAPPVISSVSGPLQCDSASGVWRRPPVRRTRNVARLLRAPRVNAPRGPRRRPRLRRGHRSCTGWPRPHVALANAGGPTPRWPRNSAAATASWRSGPATAEGRRGLLAMPEGWAPRAGPAEPHTEPSAAAPRSPPVP
jgi:hypothetical protein